MPGTGDVSPSHRDRKRMLTLRQASRLTGVRRKTIRERVRRGEIAVRLVGKGQSAKIRVTKDALAAAGLLAASPATSSHHSSAGTDLAELVSLIREQGNRIAALEDQRFQIAGQLGAALERTRALEERLHELTESTQPPDPVDDGATEANGRVSNDARLVPTAAALGVGMLAIAGQAVRKAAGRVSHTEHWSARVVSLLRHSRR